MKHIQEEKQNNRGFTLVELLVVIVILTILAAVLVPQFLSYIDQKKREAELNRAKAVMATAQAELDDMYVRGIALSTYMTTVTRGGHNYGNTTWIKEKIMKPANVPEDISGYVEIVTGTTDTSSKKAYTVYGIRYSENGQTIYYVLDDKTGVGTWYLDDAGDSVAWNNPNQTGYNAYSNLYVNGCDKSGTYHAKWATRD